MAAAAGTVFHPGDRRIALLGEDPLIAPQPDRIDAGRHRLAFIFLTRQFPAHVLAASQQGLDLFVHLLLLPGQRFTALARHGRGRLHHLHSRQFLILEFTDGRLGHGDFLFQGLVAIVALDL